MCKNYKSSMYKNDGIFWENKAVTGPSKVVEAPVAPTQLIKDSLKNLDSFKSEQDEELRRDNAQEKPQNEQNSQEQSGKRLRSFFNYPTDPLTCTDCKDTRGNLYKVLNQAKQINKVNHDSKNLKFFQKNPLSLTWNSLNLKFDQGVPVHKMDFSDVQAQNRNIPFASLFKRARQEMQLDSFSSFSLGNKAAGNTP